MTDCKQLCDMGFLQYLQCGMKPALLMWKTRVYLKNSWQIQSIWKEHIQFSALQDSRKLKFWGMAGNNPQTDASRSISHRNLQKLCISTTFRATAVISWTRRTLWPLCVPYIQNVRKKTWRKLTWPLWRTVENCAKHQCCYTSTAAGILHARVRMR